MAVEQCRYLHVPVGNLPLDCELFGCDLFYARYLIRENHVLWSSLTDTPDLGGRQIDDRRLVSVQSFSKLAHRNCMKLFSDFDLRPPGISKQNVVPQNYCVVHQQEYIIFLVKNGKHYVLTRLLSQLCACILQCLIPVIM